jgi:ribonuclease HI
MLKDLQMILSLVLEENFHVEGFADDFVISVRGKFGNTLGERMQRAFKIIENWCTPRNLRINPKKTEVIAFGRVVNEKRNINKLKLFGEEILVKKKCSDNVKYLGVYIDAGLSWNAHIDYVTSKAIKIIWTCKNMIGKTWGLNPKIMLWMYKMLVRPVISYGALVWWSKTEQPTVQIKLNKIQRIVLMMITRCMKTVPSIALEMLIDMVPLHLWIQQEAIQTNYKNCVSDKVENRKLIDEQLVRTVAYQDVLTFSESDWMTPKHDFMKNFEVIIPSREEWLNQLIQFEQNSVICYTDGSKTERGTGSGVYIASEYCEIYESLGKYATVFMSEVHAIYICIKKCIERKHMNKTIYIMSDSQATLKALSQFRVNSRIIWKCLEQIYELSRRNTVKFIWVPGHSNIDGNEAADRLAREGSASTFAGEEPCVGIALQTAKSAIFEWLIDQSTCYWELQGMHLSQHVHNFIPRRSPTRTKELLRMSVVQVRVLVAFLSGHARVLKHLKNMNLSSTDLCRICEEEEETAEHILCNCRGLENRRRRFFGCLNGQLNPTSLLEFKLHEIYDFLKGISIVKDEYNLG